MRERARKEESSVSLDYLKQIHQIHEEWLYDRTLFKIPSPVIILDANKNMDEMLQEFDKCKEKIFSKQIYNELDIIKSVGAISAWFSQLQFNVFFFVAIVILYWSSL